MQYLSLIFLWTFCFFLHSFLASNWVKSLAQKVLKNGFKFYRLFYNTVAILFFGYIYFYQSRIVEFPFLEFNIYTLILGLILMAFAASLMLLSFNNYNKAEFLGLEQLHLVKAKPQHQTLSKTGLNAYVRHPLYFATLVFFIGYILFKPTFSSLIFVGIGTIYLIIGTILEEQKLVKQFGQEYKTYQKEVKMFIPFVV